MTILEAPAKLIYIPSDGVTLEGLLTYPQNTQGLVLFVQGSGSSRHSPGNALIAKQLQQTGLGTLLFDLLSHSEVRKDEITQNFRFDILLLSQRLLAVTAWVKNQEMLRDLNLGYLGASTGTAAALEASISAPIAAIVSRGGRPDLAHTSLSKVQTPTLLIVGSRDEEVLELNRWAYKQLRCEKQLADVPGATHLFTEPGALETVAVLARHWFEKHLA
jgi:putative phosphoribosyl transferase